MLQEKIIFLGGLEAHMILYAMEDLNKPSDGVKQIAKNLTEMDNPVLVKIKMKKFNVHEECN